MVCQYFCYCLLFCARRAVTCGLWVLSSTSCCVDIHRSIQKCLANSFHKEWDEESWLENMTTPTRNGQRFLQMQRMSLPGICKYTFYKVLFFNLFFFWLTNLTQVLRPTTSPQNWPIGFDRPESSLTDVQRSLVSEEDFQSGYKNFSHKQQPFSTSFRPHAPYFDDQTLYRAVFT